jgi:hypothetical protein
LYILIFMFLDSRREDWMVASITLIQLPRNFLLLSDDLKVVKSGRMR